MGNLELQNRCAVNKIRVVEKIEDGNADVNVRRGICRVGSRKIHEESMSVTRENQMRKTKYAKRRMEKKKKTENYQSILQ